MVGSFGRADWNGPVAFVSGNFAAAVVVGTAADGGSVALK